MNDLKAESRDVKSLPNCHCSDATRIKLPEYFTCCFMLCICLITSQFCEGGIHFISQWLVSVLIDTKFVWGERKNIKKYFNIQSVKPEDAGWISRHSCKLYRAEKVTWHRILSRTDKSYTTKAENLKRKKKLFVCFKILQQVRGLEL